jgi:hypothetical protein
MKFYKILVDGYRAGEIETTKELTKSDMEYHAYQWAKQRGCSPVGVRLILDKKPRKPL